MSAVGKILVFLNLVFAFVVAAFAVLDYTARTNWADKYKAYEKAYAVVDADGRAWESKAKKSSEEQAKFNKDMLAYGTKEGTMDEKADGNRVAEKAIDVLKRQKSEIDRLKADVDKSKKEVARLETALKKSDATATVAQGNVAIRQSDNEALRATLAIVNTKNTELTASNNALRDRAVAAEIEAKSFKNRNNQLADKLEEFAKTIARLQAQGGRTTPVAANASGRNPPPEYVEGLIERVDGRFVTLTIGSDAGLVKGHTMYVYGMGANVGYRGEVRLVDVTAKVAVGEVMGKEVTRIRRGDTAASDLMPRR